MSEPDDTPTPRARQNDVPSLQYQQIADSGKEMGKTGKDVKPAYDDPLTRLLTVRSNLDPHPECSYFVGGDESCEICGADEANHDIRLLAAEVSRLRSSEAVVTDVIDRLEKHTRALHFQRTTSDNVADLVDAICEHDSKQAADVSRLREALDEKELTMRQWDSLKDVPRYNLNLRLAGGVAEAPKVEQALDGILVLFEDIAPLFAAAEADVSRLQQEHATVYTFLSRIIDVVAPSNPTAGGKTMTLCQQVDHYIVELREENALLRRSLEMLTKQMAEKGV